MQIQEIGQRGLILTFEAMEEWITNVYVCFAKNNTYLVDTYCGPDTMQNIRELIFEQAPNKPIIVINTHFHWDHIWGNCAFPEEVIIAHEKCRHLSDKYWEKQIEENHQFQMGKVIKHLPTKIILSHYTDEEDEIQILCTPGHTEDSISFYDKKDGVLFVGDNVESPLPYVESTNLDQYINTLSNYLTMDYLFMVSSHSEFTDSKLVVENIHYLEDLKNNKPQYFIDEYAAKIHKMNLQFLKTPAL